MSSSTDPTGSQGGGRLLALGLAEGALLGTLGWWGMAAFPTAGLSLFAAAFAVYASAAWVVGRGGGSHRLIWGVAVGMRLLLLPLVPELSDDVYRYLWDGHVQLSGVNPYLHAPGSEAVAELRTSYHDLVNNPDVPTIYPPLAQIAFVLIAIAGGTIFTAKALWIALDLGTAWVLGKVAESTGRDPSLVLVLYLWSPLLVIEVAWSGHLETLGLLALSLTILFARRPAVAGAALAAATLTKFAPVAALPALAARYGWKLPLGFGAVVLALYAPYLTAGTSLFSGLLTYSEHWWFMKGPFVLLESLFTDPLHARRAAGVLVLGVVAWVTYRRFDAERALFWVLGTGMILTPTLHPWYVLWMLPMAALRASKPWLLLTGLSFLGYFGLAQYRGGGEWTQPGSVRALMWLPFLLLLIYESARTWRNLPDTRPAGGE